MDGRIRTGKATKGHALIRAIAYRRTFGEPS